MSLVVDELWPSLDLDAPRASFDMAVSRLRKWLDQPEAVRVADDAVSLDTTLVLSLIHIFRCGHLLRAAGRIE